LLVNTEVFCVFGHVYWQTITDVLEEQVKQSFGCLNLKMVTICSPEISVTTG
jgi:hypothetical protein